MLEIISEGMPGGFFIYRNDESQELIYFNNMMVKLLGCSSREEFIELTGNSFGGIVHEDYYDEIMTMISSQVASDPDNIDHVTYRVNSKTDDYHWLEDYGRLVQSESYGEVFFVFVSDITDSILSERNRRDIDMVMADARMHKGADYANSKLFVSQVDDDAEENSALHGMKVLLVEDNEISREISTEILEDSGAEVTTAENGMEAFDIVRTGREFDVILMDLVMPVMDGVEATKKISVHYDKCDKDVLIIVLSSDAGGEQAQRAMRKGAFACMAKPLVVSELMRIMVEYMRSCSEKIQRRLESSIKDAKTDALTHVKNTHAYNDKIADINSIIRNVGDIDLAIVLCDINDLKKENDIYGHDSGDEYIKNSAKIICDTYLHSPVYRIGGDEFAVILQGKDFAMAERLLIKLRNSSYTASLLPDSFSGKASLASGMAIFDPSIDTEFADVVKRADIAMYENKQSIKIKESAV